MNKRKKKRGFTLVELLIVIGISGVLMAMSAPKYQGMVDKAKEMEQRAHVREALNYIDIHNLEKGTAVYENTKLSLVTGLGTNFEAILVKIHDDYKAIVVSELRKFADGDPIQGVGSSGAYGKLDYGRAL